MIDFRYAAELQEILDKSDFSLVDKLSSMENDQEDLQKYVENFMNNHEIAKRSKNDAIRQMYDRNWKTVQAFMQLRMIRKNLDDLENVDNGGTTIV